MENPFVVITEIYFNGEKISRARVSKEKLSKNERNQLVRTMHRFFENQNIRAMDIYSKISITLRENYQIELSERSIIRAVKKT